MAENEAGLPDSSEHCEYINLDVSDKKTIEDMKELIRQRHETLDILVNNAGRYEKPDTSLPTFGEQADLVINTNYWGLKNVITGMMDIFTPGARAWSSTASTRAPSTARSSSRASSPWRTGPTPSPTAAASQTRVSRVRYSGTTSSLSSGRRPSPGPAFSTVLLSKSTNILGYP